MRSKITIIIILFSIVLLLWAMVKGISIGNFEIVKIGQLVKKNDEVKLRIEEVSELIAVDYPNNIEELEATYETYLTQKRKYEELSKVADESYGNIYETKQYDIGYLWRVIGKYAYNRNLILALDVQKNKAGDSIYNLKFTVEGEYAKISQFVTDLENDSDLNFRICNFKMIGKEDLVNATFTVNSVNIDPSTISK